MYTINIEIIKYQISISNVWGQYNSDLINIEGEDMSTTFMMMNNPMDLIMNLVVDTTTNSTLTTLELSLIHI